MSPIILIILTHMYLWLLAAQIIKKIIVSVYIISELLYVITSTPSTLSTGNYVVWYIFSEILIDVPW